MGKKSWLILVVIAFAFFLRVYHLTELPLYGDELTMAYDTYSIVKTGHDQTGELLPLTFKMGAGRPGGYIYASVPFVAALGPVVGIRIVSLLSGMGIIVLIYLLARELFNDKVAKIALVLTAISPWDIYLSRAGFEAHLALFLALLGVYAFIRAKANPKLYVVWALAWGIAIHTYPTYKLTLPILFAAVLMFRGKVKDILKNKLFLTGVSVLLVFILLALRETLVGGSEARFLDINVFSDSGLAASIEQKVNYERGVSTLPALFQPVFYNKEIEYFRLVFESYVANLSPDFLLLRGDRNPRHNPGEMGMLYVADSVLIILAVIAMSRKDKKTLGFLVAWVLITPLATMLLLDTHGLRDSLMIPPFMLLSAYAFAKIDRRLAIAIALLIFIQFIHITQVVYFLAPNKFASFWSQTARLASESAIKEAGNYQIIAISDRIDNAEFAYPVYAMVDPSEVIAQYGVYPKVYGNVEIVNFDSLDLPRGVSLAIEGKAVDSENLLPGITTYEIFR